MEQTEQKIIRCKNCGEPLDLQKAQDGVVKCDVCDAYNTVPKQEDEIAVTIGFFKKLLRKLLDKIKAILKL